MEDTLRPVATFTVDQLSCEVYGTRDQMGTASARAAAAQIRMILTQRDQCRIVFAAAPSQNEFLAELRIAPGIDWRRVSAFHMDEYIGLGSDTPQSFAHFLRERLFEKVEPKIVHYLDGMAQDPQAECARYATLLREAPIDIVCAGIGENGHLAFNDPPDADFDDPKTVKIVALTLRSREQQVHDGCFADLDQVPRRALTLTIPTFMAARHIFCMVPGPTKAEAVRDTLTGPISRTCPASILRRHPAAVLYVDSDSARLC
jgi:glucosamine-6-phosphate deaminase